MSVPKEATLLVSRKLTVSGLAAVMQVVAGLEAENTNTFLQMLGAAAKLGPAADAVQVGTPTYWPQYTCSGWHSRSQMAYSTKTHMS
jgi:dihydrodipicolinate synthase/N-acetylneuraminate lyase